MNAFVVLLFCGLVVLWFGCIEGRFGWKPIPSEARVTRDEVSGIITSSKKGCLEDSTTLIKHQ